MCAYVGHFVEQFFLKMKCAQVGILAVPLFLVKLCMILTVRNFSLLKNKTYYLLSIILWVIIDTVQKVSNINKLSPTPEKKDPVTIIKAVTHLLQYVHL